MTHRTIVEQFVLGRPSLDSYWRSLIRFGRNVASYKIALGQSLLELGAQERELVILDELGSRSPHTCVGTFRWLTGRAFRHGASSWTPVEATTLGEIAQDDLVETTRRLGFQNVIDAFHVLDGADISQRFFVDERSDHGGIRLTDQLRQLIGDANGTSLIDEAESWWQLVEAAWDLNLPSQLLTVSYDPSQKLLMTGGPAEPP